MQLSFCLFCYNKSKDKNAYMGMEKGLFTHREKPLYLLRICRLPQVLFTKYLLWGEHLAFAPPLSYL